MKNWKCILEKEKNNIESINYGGMPMFIDKIENIFDEYVEIFVRDVRAMPTQGGGVEYMEYPEAIKQYIKIDGIVLIRTKTKQKSESKASTIITN